LWKGEGAVMRTVVTGSRAELGTAGIVETAKTVLQDKIGRVLNRITEEAQSASVTAYDADTLAILQAAHDEACEWLTGEDGIGPSNEVRSALALRIFEAAKLGERDKQALKSYALKDLGAVKIGRAHV